MSVLGEVLATEAGQDFLLAHAERMLRRRSLFENRPLWPDMWREGQDWGPSGKRVMKLLVGATLIRKRRGAAGGCGDGA